MRLLLLLVLIGCSTSQKTQQSKQEIAECGSDSNLISKHLVISAKSQNNSMVNCFRNYIKFAKDKSKPVYTCNTVKISRSGAVNYAYVRGKRSQSVPKDLRMCMVQSFYKMNFNSLQLDKAQTIQFPIEFAIAN